MGGATLFPLSMPTLPKISYVLLSHNREKYIRAALESAFAQDYEGELEYIISDDCSTDRTFEIIQECVANYKGGRRVVVTQPACNCRTAANFNHALSFVQSDWVVRADDDDLSAVDRCTVIAKAILQVPGCTYVATSSSYQFTDEEESQAKAKASVPCANRADIQIMDVGESGIPPIHFSSTAYSYKAWSMVPYRHFGPLPDNSYYADDYLFYWRAAVMGKGAIVDNADAVLVRKGSLNQSRGKDDNFFGYASIMRLEHFNDVYHSIMTGVMRDTYHQLEAFARSEYTGAAQANTLTFVEEIRKSSGTSAKLAGYWEKSPLQRYRLNKVAGYRGAFGMLRLLPLPLFAVVLALYRLISGK